MKNDSIAPGMRPTTKSTAISGRNTPRPNARMKKVTRRPAPPATTPAANRYHGSRRMNARKFFHPSATRGLRRGAPLNLCKKSRAETNPLFSQRRVRGWTGSDGGVSQQASPRRTSNRPDRFVDDAPDRRRDDRGTRARPGGPRRDSEGFPGCGGRCVRPVNRGRPHHARPLGDYREQPKPEACGRLDRGSGPRAQGDDSAREHSLHAEVGSGASSIVSSRRPHFTPLEAVSRRRNSPACLPTAGNIPSRVMSEGGSCMSAERQKIRAAEWLYRWNLSMSILGIVFTILTFVGVFTLVLRQYFAEFGLNEVEVLLVLLLVVLTIIFGFGFYLDKFLRFWSAQTTVATVRNQFLTSALYQKELLIMKYSQVPQMEGLLQLIEELPDSPAKTRLVEHFRDSLQKLRKTIESKEWEVAPEERTY